MSRSRDEVLASPLGKVSGYCDTYDAGLLFPIRRQPKRDEIGIAAGVPPFFGADIWNAYELSWLNQRGKPLVAIGEFRIPCTSPNIVESKSLKLYLNSLNQTRFDSIAAVRERIAIDLSNACAADVDVEVKSLSDRPQRNFARPRGILLDELDIEVDCYELSPNLLKVDTRSAAVTEALYSHLLKSNCLVTGQPDWGMLGIEYAGAPISHESLLRYIVSFRSHNEFHEQCVERIFSDVLGRCKPAELTVWARYTRRGGVDINPYRSTRLLVDFPNQAEVRQ